MLFHLHVVRGGSDLQWMVCCSRDGSLGCGRNFYHLWFDFRWMQRLTESLCFERITTGLVCARGPRYLLGTGGLCQGCVDLLCLCWGSEAIANGCPPGHWTGQSVEAVTGKKEMKTAQFCITLSCHYSSAGKPLFLCIFFQCSFFIAGVTMKEELVFLQRILDNGYPSSLCPISI